MLLERKEGGIRGIGGNIQLAGSLAFSFGEKNGIMSFEDHLCDSETAGGIPILKEVGKVKPGSVQRPKKQVHTGNLSIDFTSPIAEGTLVCIEGNKSTGKSSVAIQTAVNFMNEVPTSHVVYFTTSQKEASRFEERLKNHVSNV